MTIKCIGYCTICEQVKNLHGNSGLCRNCYNKYLLASKPPAEQDEILKRQREARRKYQKKHPEKCAQWNRKWRSAHPESKYVKRLRLSLVKWQRDIPIRTLQDAGINTAFMRGQLEEHRKQKLMNKIEAGMKLIMEDILCNT